MDVFKILPDVRIKVFYVQIKVLHARIQVLHARIQDINVRIKVKMHAYRLRFSHEDVSWDPIISQETRNSGNLMISWIWWDFNTFVLKSMIFRWRWNIIFISCSSIILGNLDDLETSKSCTSDVLNVQVTS